MTKTFARVFAAVLLTSTALPAFAYDASKINVPNYIKGQTIFRGMDVPPTVKVDDQALIDAVRRASLSAVPAEVILKVPTSQGQWDTKRVVTNIISRSAWGDPAQGVPGNVILLVVARGDNGEIFTAVKPGPNFRGYDQNQLDAIVDGARQQYGAQIAKGDLIGFSTAVETAVAQNLKQVELARLAPSQPQGSSGGVGFGTILLIVAGVAAVGGGLYFAFGRSNSNAPARPLGTTPVAPRPVTPRPSTPNPAPNRNPAPTPAAPPAVSERKRNQILRRLSNATADFNRMTGPGHYSVAVGFNTYHPPVGFLGTTYGNSAVALLAQANAHIRAGNWFLAEAALNQLDSTLAQGDRYMYWSTYNSPVFLADPFAVSYATALGFAIGMDFLVYDAYLANRYIWAGDSLLFVPPAYDVVTAPGFAFVEVIQPDYVVLDTPVVEVITPDAAIISAAPGGIEVVDNTVAAEVITAPSAPTDNGGWGNNSSGAVIEDHEPSAAPETHTPDAPVDNSGWGNTTSGATIEDRQPTDETPQSPAPSDNGWGNNSAGTTYEPSAPAPAPSDNGWGNNSAGTTYEPSTPAPAPSDSGWGNNSAGATVEDRTPSYSAPDPTPSYSAPDPTPSYSAPDPTPSYSAPDTSYSSPSTDTGGWGN